MRSQSQDLSLDRCKAPFLTCLLVQIEALKEASVDINRLQALVQQKDKAQQPRRVPRIVTPSPPPPKPTPPQEDHSKRIKDLHVNLPPWPRADRVLPTCWPCADPELTMRWPRADDVLTPFWPCADRAGSRRWRKRCRGAPPPSRTPPPAHRPVPSIAPLPRCVANGRRRFNFACVRAPDTGCM